MDELKTKAMLMFMQVSQTASQVDLSLFLQQFEVVVGAGARPEFMAGLLLADLLYSPKGTKPNTPFGRLMVLLNGLGLLAWARQGLVDRKYCDNIFN